MSGRLTILPKKTYCPWKPENVERVLRDERLERERQQAAAARSLGDEDDARRRRRRYDEGGHINLFPEAKDAELRLITGGRGNAKSKSSSSSVAAEALPPAPLGGDEADKRKSGNVPFYMRQSSESRGKYDNINGSSFRLGDNRANGVRGDEITGKIMKDQFARREDERKDKMDPMSRFYIDSSNPSCNNSNGIVASADAQPTMISCIGEGNKIRTETTNNDNNALHRHRKLPRDERTGRNHKSKRRRRRDDSSVESTFDSVSSSCASSAGNVHKRRKRSSGRQRNKSRSHREVKSFSSSEDERHHRRNRSSERKDGDARSSSHRHRRKKTSKTKCWGT